MRYSRGRYKLEAVDYDWLSKNIIESFEYYGWMIQSDDVSYRITAKRLTSRASVGYIFADDGYKLRVSINGIRFKSCLYYPLTQST